MDILQSFNTDPDKAEKGAWVDIGEGARIKIARLGNPTYQKALAKARAPYRSILMSHRELPDDIARKITIESLVEAIVIDWSGLTMGGTAIPYSKEKARELLNEFSDFRDLVSNFALDAAVFRKEALETAAGNSAAS